MSVKSILVIDDSATIRKMVDSHLSQEGYRVLLAPNGELGIEMAREEQPDLILLDHQLPGTTGIEVCRKIIQYPECQTIPFVVSSTLRKQAYVEYMDVPNVVDSLPKPFKPELLKMAVANALETGALIVSSQTNGTAVPEVVDQTDQPALSGDFQWLGLREVIDFLNNGRKEGMLEVETQRHRVSFFLKEGRIQGVASASFSPEDVAQQLPETMQELSPLLQFTMSCGASSQVDGLVQLMDKKVLDPRMLRSLLRHQAAVLTRYCFLNNPTCFSFLPERTPPALFRKTAIDSCLAAILVEGAGIESANTDSVPSEDSGWVRNALRGQNLDRTGLSAKHVQLLSHLDSTPKSATDLASRSGLSVTETRCVLEGLLLAEWVETRILQRTRTLLALEPDVQTANILRELIEDSTNDWTGNVVRDEFSMQLLLKRKKPEAVLLAVPGKGAPEIPEKLQGLLNADSGVQIVFVTSTENTNVPVESLKRFPVLRRPCSGSDVLAALAQTSTPETTSETPTSSSTAAADLMKEAQALLDTVGAH